MNRAELIKKIKDAEEKEKIEVELNKRSFIKKYFAEDYEKIKKLEVFKDLKINESEFNEVYLKTFNNDQRINIFYGGSGSGKSEYVARRYILKFLLEKGHNGIFLRRYSIDVRKSTFPLMKKVLKEYLPDYEKYVHIKESDGSFNFKNGNKIWFVGLDDPDRMKSITFENGILTDVWLEEANQLTGTEINEIQRRLRGESKVKKEIVISFNPISKANWLYVKYFNLELEGKKYHEDKKKLILKTTIYDNKYATQEDIETLEDQDDIYDKDVYLHGNFGIMSADNCIVNYSDAMHCTELEKDLEGEIYIGLDCAGMGDDRTVAKIRKGMTQLNCGFEMHKAEEEEVLEKVTMLIEELQDQYKIMDITKQQLNPDAEVEYITPSVTINVDTTGVGFGVASQLRTRVDRGVLKNVTVNSISFGGAAKNNDRYFNVVTEMYFNLRILLSKRVAILLVETDTINELCSREFTIEETKSRRRIEPKDKFKKRLKKSPDKADALVLCYYVPKVEESGNIRELNW